MTARIQQINRGAFVDAPDLQEPLNQVLQDHGDQLGLLQGQPALQVLNPVDIVLGGASTPATTPWPLRLGGVTNVVGVLLIAAQNMTSQTSVSPSGIAMSSWRFDGSTLFVDFVNGLPLNATSRLTFAVVKRGSNG